MITIIKEHLYSVKKSIIKFYENKFTLKGKYSCIFPDKIYIKKVFELRAGKKLNLHNPQTFNEKCNWLKLYDRKPIYTIMADKYLARQYISERIGGSHLIPLVGVWDRTDDIDFESLPDKFVLKCNHDNGVIICHDKTKLDFSATVTELNKKLQRNYYKKHREWPYKKIKRKIICEKLLENSNGTPLLEYNVFCFNGIPKFFKVGSILSDGTLAKDFYDINWNYLDMKTGAYAGDIFPKPLHYDDLLEIAKKLSAGTTHVRVDFYDCDNTLYNGELTFFSNGGHMNFSSEEWNYIWGQELELPKKRRR
ncbi:MAG: glycosyl transferase [Clostridia bacterium]|nr:glycosyl transferase [Clostridia bacterium]